MSTLVDRICREDVRLAESLGISLKPELAPLSIRRLCELVTELQARVAALEGAAPARSSRLSRLLGLGPEERP